MIAWLCSARGLAVLLIVSLGANLFLGGMLVGRITGEAGQDSQTRRSIQVMLAPLPEDKRDLVRREIGIAMPRVREQFAGLQKARATLAEEIVRPTPDSAGLERAFAAVQAHTTAIGTELQQAFARALPALTLEERRAVLQALSQRRRGGALSLP